jgi:hypothetical protein
VGKLRASVVNESFYLGRDTRSGQRLSKESRFGPETLTMRLAIGISILALSIGCCGRTRQLNNPQLPEKTLGWQKHQLGENVTVYGDFVIRKGESVNDGTYGIEVKNLFPAKCSLADIPGEDLPSAELRFFKVSDNSTMCMSTFRRGSEVLDPTIPNCPEGMIWSVVEISEVNARDGWVRLNLRLR